MPKQTPFKSILPSRTLALLAAACGLLVVVSDLSANPPSTAYIFPAGGQRGKTVEVHVGGYNLHGEAAFLMQGQGVEGTRHIHRIETTFFEGPLIPMPASQAKEDYPRDYYGTVKVAADAPLGTRSWNVSTSQGISASRKFIVGDLPEVVEREVDGNAIPEQVSIPVTINGRIHPREDVDIWTFAAKAGQTYTCDVNAARLGSPLDSRLEVRDPSGKPIAENVDALGTDSRLHFTARVDGTYEVRLHDVNFRGLQSYVYRLTISAGPSIDTVYPLGGQRGTTVSLQLTGANLPNTPLAVALPTTEQSLFTLYPDLNGQIANALRLELSDHPEVLEESAPDKVVIPSVLNGRISQPGEIDTWTFAAITGETLHFEIRASRLGSPLDSILTVFDAAGKQLASADDLGKNETDSLLNFKPPADGIYTIQVREQLSSRGGSDYVYRLHALKTKTAGPDFRLKLPAETLVVERGKETKLKIDVERLGGFNEEIELQVEKLPADVTISGNKIAKGKNNTQLVFKAGESAKIHTLRLRITGRAKIGEKEVTQTAAFDRGFGEEPVSDLLLAVAVPTPFKFVAGFETKYAARGTVYVRRYQLERGGFEGPIDVQLADIQTRHLQGVSGPKITLPPGTTEFDYPVTLPPWMEIGRTSRTCIMLTGEVKEQDGTKHTVSYSAIGQNDQIIVLVDPGQLNVKVGHQTVRMLPGKNVSLPITVNRGNGLTGPVTVQLILPRHIQSVASKPITIPADKKTGSLILQFRNSSPGSFNMPLTVRASVKDGRGYPVTAETGLVVVAD